MPIYWSQEASITTPKAEIKILNQDSTYNPYLMHLDDLYKRYSSPLIILNLIRQTEKKPRETLLESSFLEAVKFQNNFLPHSQFVRYWGMDYSSLYKEAR